MCISSLDRTAFYAYTKLFGLAESICFFYQEEIWIGKAESSFSRMIYLAERLTNLLYNTCYNFLIYSNETQIETEVMKAVQFEIQANLEANLLFSGCIVEKLNVNYYFY
jgi:hypothetical protein